MYTKEIWGKSTVIKDSVHGYINVPKPIAKEIIDTDIFQRLKNIEQTGMQVLYPSATHNRFMHSLGVYHLSEKAFQAFYNNVRADYPDVFECVRIKHTDKKSDFQAAADQVWKRWEMLFRLASLLHDCGHSPFSHTLEFVYDLDRTHSMNEKLKNCLSDEFKRDFDDYQVKTNKAVGKPHERMSAYFVACEENSSVRNEINGGFKNRIQNLVRSYLKAYGIFCPYDNDNAYILDDIEFMVRMIIGCCYDYGPSNAYSYAAYKFHVPDDGMSKSKEEREKLKDQNWILELQLRNCIISMLNSKLDVDNLDYVVRDSKYSGYASNNIDLERLLSSFTIVKAYEFKNTSLLFQKDQYFEGSVNLENFKGNYIKAKISGKCAIYSTVANIKAEGNVCVNDGKLPFEVSQQTYRTTDDFSANVTIEDADVNIEPIEGDKAYINISGYLEGEFQGVVLGDMFHAEKECGEKRIYFAYKQNCMSVLMSAIDGSNFESKWIYAHHTTSFKNNYLTVYLLERYAGYMVDQECQRFVDEAFLFLDKIKPVSEMKEVGEPVDTPYIKMVVSGGMRANEEVSQLYNSVINIFDEGKLKGRFARSLDAIMGLWWIANKIEDRKIEKISVLKQRVQELAQKCSSEYAGCDADDINVMTEMLKKYEGLAFQEMRNFYGILSMDTPYEVGGQIFYRTDDNDLVTAYKQLYHKLICADSETQNRYQEFMISYQQLITRDCMKCLWKTYPEYNYYFSEWTADEIKELKGMLHRPYTPWRESQGEKQLGYSILSDYVTLGKDAKLIWDELKQKYQMKRLVYVEQQIKTKVFKPYETYMKDHQRVVRLEDIKLYPNQENSAEFFFFYYEQDSNGKPINIPQLLQELKQKVKAKMNNGDSEEEAYEQEIDMRGNMIIRDNVHGDISFAGLFKALVDTKEFQRLRRIKQLATCGQVYPGAIHTRFGHSIGTYHIMVRILAHFDNYFKKIDCPLYITEADKMAIKAAALLHDVGHGPFSHAFEAADLAGDIYNHAIWTKNIILRPGTEIHQTLEAYKVGFAEEVAKYIEYENNIKDGAEKIDNLDESLDLKFIFASLVSGQIDADRMDYLLRDAYFSGTTHGKFDLDKVIDGLEISVESTGRYRVCIQEDYLPYIEEYFYARYQMHKNVYFHPYKMLSEELFRKILREAQNKHLKGELSGELIPPVLKDIFIHADTDIKIYCELDDNVVMGAIQTWSKQRDKGLEALSFLCRALLDRRYYKKLEIARPEEFLEQVERMLGKNSLNDAFLIKCSYDCGVFDDEKPVFILKKSGIIVKLSDISMMSKEKTSATFFYYSREMMKDIYQYNDKDIKDFERLIEKSGVYNNMEIEKKYVFDKEKRNELKEKLIEILQQRGYKTEMKPAKQQVDTYFDTNDLVLKGNNYTLRIREKGDKKFLTCKSPVASASNGIKGQLERKEIEESVECSDLAENRECVMKALADLNDSEVIFSDLEPNIRITNNRIKINILKETAGQSREKYELVLDEVEYFSLSSNKSYEECQIEIELKSSYQNRINMKMLTDHIEHEIDFIEAIGDSKYERALKFTS